MSGGGGTNTIQQQAAPNPIFENAYQSILSQAQGVAAQPLQQYQGQQVANLTPAQQQAFQEVGNAQGQAQPYINAAQGNFQAATTPLFSEPNSGLNYIQEAGGTNVGAAGQPGIAAATVGANTNIGAAGQTGINAATAAANTNPNAVSAYLSPYTSDVVNATQAEFNNQNQQAQETLAGQEVGQGAWGGDRTGIAAANLANQEQLAQAPVIANLENTGYQTAMSQLAQQEALKANTGISAANLSQTAAQQEAALEASTGISAANLAQTGAYQTGQLATGAAGQEIGANEANAWLNSQAGFGTAALGSQAQNEALSGASAELQTGALQQQQNQAELNVPYEQFLQQQAYPFQTTNFLNGIVTGTGSLAGGTSSSQSMPSALSQITGLGETGLGLNSIGAFDGLGSGIGGLFGAGAAGISSGFADAAVAADAAAGVSDLSALSALPALAKHGGAVPHRASGGIAAAANDDEIWNPPYRMTGTGGIQGYDEGGDVDDVPVPTARPYLAGDPQQPTGIAGISAAEPDTTDTFGYVAPTAPMRSRGQTADEIRSNAPGMALLTAGLATLGSGNIGKGGLEGVKYYTGQQQQAEQLEEKQAEAADTGAYRSADLAAKGKELSDQAERAKAQLAQADAHFGVTSEETAKKDAAEAKYQQGMLANDIKKTEIARKAALNPLGIGMGTSGTSPQGGTPKTGADFLATLPPNVAGIVKGIGDGREAPLSGLALAEPAGQAIMGAVYQYNPDYDATLMPTRQASRRAFASGADGKSVQALDAATSHLDVVKDLAKALDNGDVQAINYAKNKFQQAFGVAAPDNLDAANTIVGPEIIKAVVPGGGGQQEREHAMSLLNGSKSWGQLAGNIDTIQNLFGGQISALKQKYEFNTKLKDFDDMLQPTMRTILQKHEAAQQAMGGLHDGQILHQNGYAYKVVNGVPVPQGPAP